MNSPRTQSPPDVAKTNFAGKIWIDIAQVTRIETTPDGKRQIRAGVIAGWAIGPDPFTTIEVILGNKRIARAKVGRYRPDVAELYPSIPHAEYTGFEAVLTHGYLPESPCQLVLMAVSTVGKVFVKRYPLAGSDGQPSAAMTAMRTHIERCEIDATGMLCVAGWAVAQAPVISVQLFGNGQKIAGTLPGQPRPDVAAMFPQYPNAERSGFFVTLPLPAAARDGTGAITIEVLARDGTLRRVVTTPQRVRQIALPNLVQTPLLAPSPGHLAPSGPMAPTATATATAEVLFNCDYATLDTVGRFHGAGWLLSRSKIQRVSISRAGARYGTAITGKPRPDVAKAYPGFADSIQAGFELVTEIPGSLEDVQKVDFVVELADGTEQSFECSVEHIEPGAVSESAGDAVLMAVDGMQIEAGHAKRPITGSFHLMGWAVALDGIAKVEVHLDGVLLGQAYHGMRREDVGAAFPSHHNSLLGGFAFAVPKRHLNNGRSRFRVVAFDRMGFCAELSFTADIDISADNDPHSLLRQKMPWTETMTSLQIMASRGPAPVCDLLIRLDGRRDLPARVQASLDSLARQAWPQWQAWLVPGDSGTDTAALLADLAAALPDHAGRIALLDSMPPETEGPGFLGVLNAGDVLAVDGLLAPLLAAEPGDGLLYGDDRRADPIAPGSLAAYLKPAWSPDLLLSQNYIGRAWLATRELVKRAGLAPVDLAATGDYSNVLRLTAAADGAIRHVPGLMLAAAGKGESPSVERRALQAHLRDRGDSAKVRPGAAPFLHRLERRPAHPGKVSIIIPSIGAKDHILRCIESIHRQTQNAEFEIVVVDNIRRRRITPEGRAWKKWFRANADVVVEVDEPFNWSRLNNLGAAAASGDYLLFLNDDIEVLTPDWLTVLMAEAERPEVGVVGPQLLYPDGKVQHAGMFLSRSDVGNARHAFRFSNADDPGYFGIALSQRNLLCVTGACMMVRRAVFDAVNGFDEAHSVVNNDVDFCLRLHRSGRLVVFTPHTRLTHYELASRAHLKDDFDRSGFLETWGDLCLAGDPYLNPAISSEADDYAPEEEPLREVYAGHPLGARDAIKRILAVKLDHIGDLVTALPAFRRLKALFPQAHLTALVGRSAMSIASMETAIDELIPFEFFDARSGLGRKKLTKADYAALEADLTARRFDLAVDLRKLGDTRHILQLSGAPLLAGFDHNNDFPWLDVTLEWERDALQVDKRSHVTTDLLNLTEAVGTAFTTERRTITTPAAALPPISEALSHEFADLFAHDYVVLHPAAGTPLRQWSPVFFARLIDLLAEEDGMRIALIGGPDEREIAERVLAAVRRQDRVFNLVGRSKLSEVPRIMAESVLFVGNNSGPSHIASGLGVPTVAVHSALVSSREWGPLGPSAVALRRDMSCAPCYIVNVDQCHRGMACLHSLSPYAVHRICRRFLALRRSG